MHCKATSARPFSRIYPLPTALPPKSNGNLGSSFKFCYLNFCTNTPVVLAISKYYKGIKQLIPGTGGVRKLRIEDVQRGKGKRGGYRILYLDLPKDQEAFLITFYGKDEADDISSDAKKVISQLVAAIKSES